MWFAHISETPEFCLIAPKFKFIIGSYWAEGRKVKAEIQAINKYKASVWVSLYGDDKIKDGQEITDRQSLINHQNGIFAHLCRCGIVKTDKAKALALVSRAVNKHLGCVIVYSFGDLLKGARYIFEKRNL